MRPRAVAGSGLTCLVLFAGSSEWVGVDCTTGAVLRSRPGEASRFLRVQSADGDRRVTRFDVVTVPLGSDDETIDPARPEAIGIAEMPTYVGRPRLRPVRRLLRELAAPQRRGATLLVSWGPSIAYTDLDGSQQSVAIVETSPRQLALAGPPRRDGRRVGLVVGDHPGDPDHRSPRGARALDGSPGPLTKGALVETLGFRPSYLVCVLGRGTRGTRPESRRCDAAAPDPRPQPDAGSSATWGGNRRRGPRPWPSRTRRECRDVRPSPA